jgi:hypothetical protein
MAGHVALMREMHTKFWPGNLKGRDHSEEIGIKERIISDWILGK